jgi:hypothetical protein
MGHWPVGGRNTRLLQRTVVTRAEDWARASGATFEADKRAFIHFIRTATKWSDTALVVLGEEIRSQTEVKILGVVFDQALRSQQHTARAAKRGVNTALCIETHQGHDGENSKTALHSDGWR